MFQNIVSVDRDEHVVTISENLNAVLDEVRQHSGKVPNIALLYCPILFFGQDQYILQKKLL